MARLHYIVPFGIWSENLHLFSESHYVPTDDAKLILVACKFQHECHLDAWESIEGVQTLIAYHHHILTKVGAQPGHTKEQLIEKAGAVHRLLRQERI